MIQLLRRLKMWPQLGFGMARAKAVARAECGRRSWPWTEPIECTESWFSYHFRTNAGHVGANADVWVDGRTGVVRKAGYMRGIQTSS
jgi:hypothetical protein